MRGCQSETHSFFPCTICGYTYGTEDCRKVREACGFKVTQKCKKSKRRIKKECGEWERNVNKP